MVQTTSIKYQKSAVVEYSGVASLRYFLSPFSYLHAVSPRPQEMRDSRR
jgi:hypothetical protein